MSKKKVDEAEKLVEESLAKQGFIQIVHQPDVNDPPDFLLDGRIAVEVRRLNSHCERPNGITYTHQENYEPVRQGLENLLTEFGSSINGETWAVSFALDHPFKGKGWSGVKRLVKDVLRNFKDSKERLPIKYRIQDCIEIDFLRCGAHHEKFYIPGFSAEDVQGCLIVDEIYRNLKIVFAEKNRKVTGCRDRYPEWWLVLVDYIGFDGLDQSGLEQLRSLSLCDSNWDKVIFVCPHNTDIAFEI